MLRRRFHETLDIAAARKMLPDCAHHNNAHVFVLVERLKSYPQLIALWHLDDVERRPVEDNIGAFLSDIDFHTEADECGAAWVGRGHRHLAAVPLSGKSGGALSVSYSPATSFRRRSLPTGDLGISRTNK